jgi:hypothetical protein
LNLSFDEHRDVVGHYVDTRRMVVGITVRHQEKIVRFIESEGWLTPPKKATIQEIASVYGQLDNVSEFFPWARAHLLNLRNLLADCIKRTYAIAKRSIPLQQRLDAAERVLPRQLRDHLASMQCRLFAEFVWRNQWRVSVDMPSRRGIRIIYVYLSKGLPWEQPIGHVVERDPAFDLTTDSSEEAVGVCVPTIKVICIIPLSDGLRKWLPSLKSIQTNSTLMSWNLWVSLWPFSFSLNGAVVVSLSSHHIQLLPSHVTTPLLSCGAGKCQPIRQSDRTCSASLPSSVSCLSLALPLPTLLVSITRLRISSHFLATCIPRPSLLLLTVRFSLTSSKHVSRKKNSHPGQSSCQRLNCCRPYA